MLMIAAVRASMRPVVWMIARWAAMAAAFRLLRRWRRCGLAAKIMAEVAKAQNGETKATVIRAAPALKVVGSQMPKWDQPERTTNTGY
jgi:hypothetical protein